MDTEMEAATSPHGSKEKVVGLSGRHFLKIQLFKDYWGCCCCRLRWAVTPASFSPEPEGSLQAEFLDFRLGAVNAIFYFMKP